MPDFAYTTVPAKIPQLLAKIRDVGVPQKATANWLKTVGFTSSNDSSLIPVLGQINFVDSSNVPTSGWHNYRGLKHAEVLANSIKKGYSNLFDIYADANSRTQSEVASVFTNASTAGR